MIWSSTPSLLKKHGLEITTEQKLVGHKLGPKDRMIGYLNRVIFSTPTMGHRFCSFIFKRCQLCIINTFEKFHVYFTCFLQTD